MKLKKARIFSAILAATMLFNTTGMTVLAESNNESVVAELETETSVEETNEETKPEAESVAETTVQTESAENVSETTVVTEEASIEHTTESEEQQTSEMSETESAIVEETTTEEDLGEAITAESTEETTTTEEDLTIEEETETEELFPGLPDSYKLSSRQLEDKLKLAEYADEITALADDEGNTNAYAKGEVVYLADSREEAQTVADAFGGELQEIEAKM